MDHLFSGVMGLTDGNVIMFLIGFLLLWISVKNDVTSSFLASLGFGTILANIPFMPIAAEGSPITFLLKGGIFLELLPLALLVVIGAMSDFSHLIRWPASLFYSIPAQLGLFAVLSAAAAWGFTMKQAAAISILGAVQGPAAIYVATQFAVGLLAPIALMAYLHPLLQPIIQPPLIKLLTTKKDRCICMDDARMQRPVSKTAKILFPVGITVVVGLIVPLAVTMIGLLMFGNLLRESVLLKCPETLAKTAVSQWGTAMMGFFIGIAMGADTFLTPEVAVLAGFGLLAILLDVAGGVLFIKIMNIGLTQKINPILGACGVSFFRVSAKVIADMAGEENARNSMIGYANGIHAANGIISVIVSGLILIYI